MLFDTAEPTTGQDGTTSRKCESMEVINGAIEEHKVIHVVQLNQSYWRFEALFQEL